MKIKFITRTKTLRKHVANKNSSIQYAARNASAVIGIKNQTQNSNATELARPPKPPIILTPLIASNPSTDQAILWHIARNIPELRKWVIANPSAGAKLLEYISQRGGPDVRHSFEVLFAGYDSVS